MINIYICVKIKKQTQKDGRPESQRIAHRLSKRRQMCGELLTTWVTVTLTAQQVGFLSRSHHQTTSGPPCEQE